MTPDEAVAAIDAIDATDDPEAAHGALEDILLDLTTDEVRRAAIRLVLRCARWADA